ncbi:MAG: 4-alpha-glucanotransferase [Anaerolineales bacterium]|nr:MAG: 4-alpha-glucanotransferase [Anaerolineales bacterium]
MKFNRSGGILLHPTSLPGPYGIGDLGPQAYRFVDWLASTGCKLWQTLPLGPTGYGDSPYQCFSAFAGNPYLISFDGLIEDGLLMQDDFADMPDFDASRVDFGLLIPWKLEILQKAFSRFQSASDELRAEFDEFCNNNTSWLDDFALFMSIKEANGGGAWNEWDVSLRNRKKSAMDKARRELSESILRYFFYQFIFFRQWDRLRAYANERDIRIIGDIPIFIAYDSADAWSNQKLFFLGEDSLPTVVAGVPPDYFSATGQLWGNPLYRWDEHQKTGYAWWLDRFRAVLKMVDVVRVDHFRGFAGYWEIPFGSPTAEHGQWIPGPGSDFFKTMNIGLVTASDAELPIIAEDLGVITPDVVALRDEFNLPGMRILQFGFSGADNPFLPHNYISNCVAYTGTHDNDTALGWLDTAPEEEREFALRYLRVDGSDFAWDLIHGIWSSVAVYAVTPMQDALSLGTEARMNFPSKLGGNWEWRMTDADLSDELAGKFRELNKLYLR